MSNIGIDIRARGKVNVKNPYFGTSSISHNSIFTLPEYVYIPSTFRFGQSSFYNVVFNTSTISHNSDSRTEDIYVPITARFGQSSFSSAYFNLAGINYTIPIASGVYETLFRPIIEIKEKALKFSEDTRVKAKTTYSFANQSPTDVYFDLDESIQTVDTTKSIVWWGPSEDDDYISIEYRKRSDDGIWETTWHDISESLSFIIANGAETVQPTFSWTSGYDPDEQEVVYDLIIAFDYSLQNIALLKENIEDTTYSLENEESLDVDQIYFWAIRTKDSVGDVSPWSNVRSFETLKNIPPNIQIIDGKRKLLIPFREYKYDWNIGNLESGMYQYAFKKIKIDGSEPIDIIRKTGNGRYFIVDHETTNSPSIINIKYKPQNYKLSFDVQIRDSKFRNYNIKSVAYANQKSKITGADKTGYYLQSFNWKNIPLTELIGNKRNLTSNPYLSKNAIFGWTFSGNRVVGKKYTYDMRVHSESNAYVKDVYIGYKTLNSVTGEWSDWIKTKIDVSDPLTFKSPRGYRDPVPPKIYNTSYYGKANPLGYIMNTVYFKTSPGRNDIKWQFGLFKEGEENPSYTEESVKPLFVVKPKRFYDLGFTNVLLDLTNIEYENYELVKQEIDKITESIPNKDFFWQVRVYDGFDYSSWSSIQKNKDFNIHSLEWDIRNDPDFKSSNFIVLKVEVELTEPFEEFEYPNFNWLSISNPQINQYIYQIRALEERLESLPEYIKPIYNSYISYLNRRIKDVRNYVLDGLIEDGYFDNEESFQDFINKNIHDDPVVYNNGEYSSELDIHNDFIEKTKDISTEQWSSLLYTWRMDIINRSYKSQNGKPLRSYDKTSMACENEAYKNCYLTTGNPNTCPWFGRSDLGFCGGFFQTMTVKGNTNDDIPLPDSLSDVPDVDIDPEGYAAYLNEQQALNDLYEAEDEATEEAEVSLGFDPGNCPMAKGASLGQNGSPCIRYKDGDHDFNQKKCEICGEKRYPQFVGMKIDKLDVVGANIYSTINPAGFASVSISFNEEELDSWGPIVNKGQSLNPQKVFTGIKLKKSQLPGELNSDVLDFDNEEVVKNPFFKNPLLGEVSPSGILVGGWYPVEKPSNLNAQVIEII